MARYEFFKAFIGLLIAPLAVAETYTWYNPTSQRYFPGQQFQQQNTYRQPNNVEIVEGTIDQLNRIDAKWVCTNPKTGDQMIFGTEKENGNTPNNNAYPQMNLPTINANRWNTQQPYNPGQQIPTYNSQGQIREPYYQGQVPGYNLPGQIPVYNPQNQVPGYNSQGQVVGRDTQGQTPNYQPQGQVLEQNPLQTQQAQNTLQMQQLQKSGPGTTQAVDEQARYSTSTVESTTEDFEKKFENFDWTAYVTKRPVTTSAASTIVEFDGQGILEPRTHD